MRIVHCFRSPVGGIFRHVRDLALEHASAGHKVGIVCDSTTGGTFEDNLFEEIRPHLELGVIRMPIGRSIGPSDLRALWSSYKEIKELQPDVLHGHGAKGGAFARIIGSLLRANRYRVARLYSPHGGSLHFTESGMRGWIVFQIEKVLQRFNDATLFVSSYERDAYRKKIGRPGRLRIVYNGLAEQEFEPVQPETEQSDFLFIGMLRDLKGPDLFIKAFAEAERKVGRPLSAIMIGDGPDEEKYRHYSTSHGLGRRIPIFPAVRQRIAFAKARTVVVSSRADALPYIVMEAVAAGLPVIAFAVGGIPEILGRGNPALVAPEDWEELGRVMANSINDPNWKATVMPDREMFHHRFSKETMASDIMGVYREILSELAA